MDLLGVVFLICIIVIVWKFLSVMSRVADNIRKGEPIAKAFDSVVEEERQKKLFSKGWTPDKHKDSPDQPKTGQGGTQRVPCPYCAELILPAAKKCPFCRSDL